MNIKKDIQFLKNAIKSDGKKSRVYYSKGSYTKESKLPKGTITIYAKDYGHLPNALKPQNESDIMTDYFEKDRVRIKPSSKYYQKVNKAYADQELKNKILRDKRMKKARML